MKKLLHILLLCPIFIFADFPPASPKVRVEVNDVPAGVAKTISLIPGSGVSMTGSCSGNKCSITINSTAVGTNGGDVVGPAVSVDNEIALFEGTTGKLIKRLTATGLLRANSGVVSTVTPTNNSVLIGTGTDFSLSTIPSCSNPTTSKLLYDNSTRTFSCGTDQLGESGSGITSLNGLTATTQTFNKTDDTNVTLSISSASSSHTFTLGWTGRLGFSRLAQGSALSVLGVAGNSTSDVASITASTDYQVLRRSGTSLGFGAINLAQNAAVTGILNVANGGTGIASGISGGIPYFSNTTTIASSAALTANSPLIGGGVGNPPTVGSRSGNTTEFATVSGTKTINKQLTFDANGNIIASTSDLSSSAPLNLTGTTDAVQLNVKGHTTQTNPIFRVQKSDNTSLFAVNNDGTIDVGGTGSGLQLTEVTAPSTPSAGKGELYADSTSSNLSYKNSTGTVSVASIPVTCSNQFMRALATTGIITCGSITTTDLPTESVTAGSTLTTNLPILGNANNRTVKTGTRSGNTTEFATVSGTKTVSKQLAFDANGNIIASTYDVGGSGTGLGDPGANGIVVRTALNVTTNRTITGTTNEITVSNGDGVSGNPTLSFPATINLSGKTALQVPAGAAPSVTSLGSIAVDTTSDQLQFYGGAKRALPSIQQFSFVIPSPAETDDMLLMKAPYGMTILTIRGVLQGTTSVAGQLQECNSVGASCADLDSDILFNGGEDGDDGALTDNTIASGNWIAWKTTSVTGTPNFLTVTVTYRVVPD